MNFQTKLYVGNLPKNCPLEAFRSLFEKYGEVVECDIIKDYGFVHFSDGEDARLAVEKLNFKKWKGMTLRVQLSSSRVRHKPGMGDKTICYWCGKSGHWAKYCPKRQTYDLSWNRNNKSHWNGDTVFKDRHTYSSANLRRPIPKSTPTRTSSYNEWNITNERDKTNSNYYHSNILSNISGFPSNEINDHTPERDLDKDNLQNYFSDNYRLSLPMNHRLYPSTCERQTHQPSLLNTSDSFISSLQLPRSSSSHRERPNWYLQPATKYY